MLILSILFGAFGLYRLGYFYGQDDERLKWQRWLSGRQGDADERFWTTSPYSAGENE